MAKKIYRFHARVGVHDTSLDTGAVTDASGVTLMGAARGVRYIDAGEPVELDETEGNRILGIVGPYRGPSQVAGAETRVIR
jgi:hypothetical protein